METARQEAEMVLFPVVEDLLRKTGAGARGWRTFCFFCIFVLQVWDVFLVVEDLLRKIGACWGGALG
jgi:hypothetical protein